MESQKEDRRIRRTQKMLKDSLIELMTERDFKNISVKDITERADLNRGTFYNHYITPILTICCRRWNPTYWLIFRI